MPSENFIKYSDELHSWHQGRQADQETHLCYVENGVAFQVYNIPLATKSELLSITEFSLFSQNFIYIWRNEQTNSKIKIKPHYCLFFLRFVVQ